MWMSFTEDKQRTNICIVSGAVKIQRNPKKSKCYLFMQLIFLPTFQVKIIFINMNWQVVFVIPMLISFSVFSCITSETPPQFPHQTVPLKTKLEFIVAEIGQTLKLKCTFAKFNQITSWNVKGQTITFPGKDIQESFYASTLTVKNVTTFSMGDYICQRDFEVHHFHVMPDTTNEWIESSFSQGVQSGNEVELLCASNRNFMKPRWYFRGLTGTERNFKMKMGRGGKTVIKHFSEWHEGVFECRATNRNLTKQSFFIKLSLTALCDLSEKNNDDIEMVSFASMEGNNMTTWLFPQKEQSLTLQCTIPDGTKSSFWGKYLDDQRVYVVNDSNHIVSFSLGNVMTLFISSFAESMYGSLFCVHDFVVRDAFYLLADASSVKD